mmetsp:Transcript_27421/g.83425  ORF Transcript_27421/g.83425 Transcript_27421/m.83425 type:complete len:240 (+) Transcript_27421:706-1425(+)
MFRRHGDVRLELFLLLRRAVLHCVYRASWPELFLSELLEIVEGSASLVFLAVLVGRIEIFNRGVASHAVLLAQRLAGRGAVNIANEHRLGVLVDVSEGVPIGLHLLAVASPGCEELNKCGLARLEHQLVKVVRSEINSAGGGADDGREQSSAAQHCGRVGLQGRRRRRRRRAACRRWHLGDGRLLDRGRRAHASRGPSVGETCSVVARWWQILDTGGRRRLPFIDLAADVAHLCRLAFG